MRQITIAAAIVGVFLLTACGGGGSDPATTVESLAFPRPEGQSYQVNGLPVPRASDAQHMPIYHDGRYLAVGVDQGMQHVVRLPEVGTRGDIEVRHGRASDGVGSGVLAAYLDNPELWRFSRRPTVRLVGDNTTTEELRYIRSAVQLVNAALPEWARMQISASRAETHEGFAHTISGDGIYYASGAESGVIYIEVVTRAEHRRGAAGTAWSWQRGDGIIDHSYIQIVNDYPREAAENVAPRPPDPEWNIVSLIAHEIIHALGVDYHVPSSMDSIMDRYHGFYGPTPPLSVLYPADREALRAIYSGTSAGDYGPWESNSLHLVGVGADAAFGVALRNGYAEPWAYGLRPRTTLANNRTLSGSVTWTGALLGLTPAAAAVAGDAEIGVNLGTMAGRADFTSLETWAAHAAPGEAGTGTQWLDGDLGYTLAVSGNTFRETGGDAGRLTGIFTGRSHEGAAGTLERPDLTAAFGASR